MLLFQHSEFFRSIGIIRNPDYNHPQQAFSYWASEDLLRCYSDGDLFKNRFFKNSCQAAGLDKYKTWMDYNDNDEIGMDFLIFVCCEVDFAE